MANDGDIVKLGFEVDSSALDQAKKAAQGTATEVGKLGDKLGQVTKQGEAAQQGMSKLAQAGQGLQKSVSGASNTIGQLATAFGVSTGSGAGVALNAALIAANKGVEGLSGMMGRFGPSAVGVTAGIGSLATAFVGASAAIASVEDKYRMYESRLKNALGSQGAALDMMNQLHAAAKESGLAFDATADTFLRMARNGEALGATREELMTLTATVQKLGVVSGASGGEVASGMLQLSQALASGKLNGDELRAVMENMPALAKAIADGMKVSVGQLRAMGAAGELTGDKVFRSILSQSSKVGDEFKSMPNTMEREFQRVSDSFSSMIANLGKQLESSKLIQTLLKAVGGTIDLIDKAAAKQPASSREKTLEQSLENFERTYKGRESQMPSVYKAQKKELEELRAARVAATAADVDARKTEEQNALASGHVRTLGLITDDLDKEKNRKKEQEKLIGIENAQIAIKSGAAKEMGEKFQESSKNVELLNKGLVQSRQKMLDLADAVSKLNRENDKMASAIHQAGGGGGIGIIQQAQQMVEQAARDGDSVSISAAMSAATRQKALGVVGDTNNLKQKTESIAKMTESIGQNRDAVREAEIATESMDYKWSQFGKLTGPTITKVVADYTEELRKNKEQIDANAAAQQIANAKLATQDAADLANSGSALERKKTELENQIRAARRGISGKGADALESEIRKRNEAEISDSVNQQLWGIKAQVEQTQVQIDLLGGVGKEHRVQTELMMKKIELEQSGVAYTEAQKNAIMDATQALAEQRYMLEQNQEIQNSINSMWDRATDALANFVVKGKLDFKGFADFVIMELARIQIKRSIIEPLSGGLNSILGGFFSGGAKSNPGISVTEGFSGGGPVTFTALGNVFNSETLKDYHNTIVSSPTLFKFAKGGAFNNGVMGEAGPEAVIPLKRAADGSLGVRAQQSEAPAITINVTNNSGTSVNARQQDQPRFNGEEWVLGIVLEAVDSNPQFRSALGVGR